MRKIVGITMIFGLLGWTILSSAKQYWPVFIDIPSLLIVVVPTIGFMLVTGGEGDWSVLLRFLSGARGQSQSNPPGITPKQAQSLCLFLLGGSRVALISGFIGTLIGLVIMLMNMDDPSAIGPAMAVAIITLLYGGIISELVLMMMYRIAVKRYWFDDQAAQTVTSEAPKGGNGLVWMLSGGGLGLILICFFTIILSMSEVKRDSYHIDSETKAVTVYKDMSHSFR